MAHDFVFAMPLHNKKDQHLPNAKKRTPVRELVIWKEARPPLFIIQYVPECVLTKSGRFSL